jgi:hypothetical protein
MIYDGTHEVACKGFEVSCNEGIAVWLKGSLVDPWFGKLFGQ